MGGWVPLSPWKPIAGSGQNVSIGAASTQAANKFGAQTRACYVYASANCHIRIGQNPTAVATDTFIVGGASGVVLGCNPNDLIAVIQDSAGGTLNVTDLTH